MMIACSVLAAGKTVTISGKVTDARTGKGIAGVPVCDGTRIVLTGRGGKYKLATSTTTCHNVFVITPAQYEFNFGKYGGWADFVALDTTCRKQTANFVLQPRTGDVSKCRLLVLGDPQQMSSRPHSIASWTYVSNALADYKSSWTGAPLYAVSLGDMVTNEIEVPGKAEAYLEKQAKSGIGFFCVPGNHDHVQKAPTYYKSVEEFCRWFGPYNYAFNVGGVHCIFLDTCAWRETPDSKFEEGFNAEALAFLREDLALVDISTPVMIFTHCPVTKTYGGKIKDALGLAQALKLLEGRNVEMWYGHIHFNANWSYTPEELAQYATGLKSLGSHLVARCGGNWACSGEITRDGAPRGFVELDIAGSDIHWQYHSIDPNYADDMMLMAPGTFAADSLEGLDNSALYCNVYMWDNSWGTPEVWIDGKCAGTMTRLTSGKYDAYFDPMYAHFYPQWQAAGLTKAREEPAKSYDNSHLFEFVPEAGVRAAEVRVRDKWGEMHSSAVNW